MGLCASSEGLFCGLYAEQTNQTVITAKPNHRCLVSVQDVVCTLRNYRFQKESLRQLVGLREWMTEQLILTLVVFLQEKLKKQRRTLLQGTTGQCQEE